MPERTHFTETDARRVGEQIGIDWKSAPFDVEQLARLVVTALQLEHRDEPERAREEDALAGGEPVDAALLGAVPRQSILLPGSTRRVDPANSPSSADRRSDAVAGPRGVDPCIYTPRNRDSAMR